MKVTSLGIVCALVLCGILVAGLWPFRHPRNDVTWLEKANGLRFDRTATVLSSGTLKITGSRDEASCSLEIWLQPSLTGESGTILAFSTPEDPLQFSLRQSDADLELQRSSWTQPHQTRSASFYASHVFGVDKRLFITATSGPQRTSIYADGALVTASREFRFARNHCTGQLVLGDAPMERNSWSGELLGLAIYHRELTRGQVLHHYQTWVARGRPEISENDGPVALYLFDEHRGHVVHNHVCSGIELYIPERYVILHQAFLKSPWKEFQLSWHYLADLAINIAGFIPLGFFFCAYFLSGEVKRPALATIMLGGTVSLTIEVLQAYLPTRYSGTTDLVTNTLGTYIGVILHRCKATRAFLAKL